MTTTKKVTKRQAEAVLAAVKRQCSPWLSDGNDRPVLIMDWDWLGYGPCPSIVWEGGPYEWAMLFPFGGIEEEFGFKVPEAKLPEGIWTEAMTSFAISIYREEG